MPPAFSPSVATPWSLASSCARPGEIEAEGDMEETADSDTDRGGGGGELRVDTSVVEVDIGGGESGASSRDL